MDLGDAFGILRVFLPRLAAFILLAGVLLAPQQTTALMISIGQARVQPMIEAVLDNLPTVPDQHQQHRRP